MSEFQYPNHTFLLRYAPRQSRFAGSDIVFCELRCQATIIGPHGIRCKELASMPLKELQIPHTEYERWVHPRLGWKLLRFTVDNPIDLIKLHEACLNPDIEARDQETYRHLAAMLGNEIGIRKLRAIASRLEIPKASRLKKAELLEVLGVAA